MTKSRWMQCYYCGREFRDRKDLKRHIELHVRVPKGEEKICCMCEKTFPTRSNVLHHYSFDHYIAMIPRFHEFDCLKLFVKWKKEVERTTRTLFVKKRGAHVNKAGARVMYYWCHCDGMTPQERLVFERMKRRMDSQDRYRRVHIHCPAMMKVVVLRDGRVSVSHVPTHVGHAVDAVRMKIAWENKLAIAKMMRAGASYVDIIDEFRERKYSDPRLETLNVKDLKDIARQFNVRRATCRTNPLVIDKAKRQVFEATLSTINSIWEEIQIKIETVDEAVFVLKMLPPILSTLKAMKRERLRELLIDKASELPNNRLVETAKEKINPCEPPPLVFYPKLITDRISTQRSENKSLVSVNGAKKSMKSLVIPVEPPGLVPMSRKRKLTDPAMQDELYKKSSIFPEKCAEIAENVVIEPSETPIGVNKRLNDEKRPLSDSYDGSSLKVVPRSSGFAAEADRGEPPPLVILPSKVGSFLDFKKESASIPVKIARQKDVVKFTADEPPKLVLIPDLADKLIKNKQHPLKKGNSYLIRKPKNDLAR